MDSSQYERYYTKHDLELLFQWYNEIQWRGGKGDPIKIMFCKCDYKGLVNVALNEIENGLYLGNEFKKKKLGRLDSAAARSIVTKRNIKIMNNNKNKIILHVYSADNSMTVISPENIPEDLHKREVILGPNYKFEYEIIGDTYNECMQKHYDKMGFGTYKPMDEEE